jgi:hypothetical protein
MGEVSPVVHGRDPSLPQFDKCRPCGEAKRPLAKK